MVIFFLIGLLIVSYLWDFYVRKNWSKHLIGKLSIEKPSLYAGQDNVLTEVIENRKWLPLPVLEVGFSTDRSLLFESMENTSVSDNNYKRDIFSLMGRQRITRHLKMRCSKRGYYQIPKIQMNSYSYFFHKQYIEEVKADVNFYVYPRRVDVSQIVLGCEGMLGSLQCAKRIYEDPFAFQGIRQYTTTDPMKHVNWKASARTGQLMVNTFESTKTEQVMLFLDISDRGVLKQTPLVEELISVAGSLSQRLIKAGMEVGIRVNDTKPVYFSPKATGAQQTMVEQMLAKIDLNKKEETTPFDAILEDISSDVMPVFLSKDYRNMPRFLEKALGRNQQAIWVYMTDEKQVQKPELPDGVRFMITRVQD